MVVTLAQLSAGFGLSKVQLAYGKEADVNAWDNGVAEAAPVKMLNDLESNPICPLDPEPFTLVTHVSKVWAPPGRPLIVGIVIGVVAPTAKLPA